MLIRILQQNFTLGLIQRIILLTLAVDSDEKNKNKKETKRRYGKGIGQERRPPMEKENNKNNLCVT